MEESDKDGDSAGVSQTKQARKRHVSLCDRGITWTAWQSVDVEVVMGKTMRSGSTPRLALPLRSRGRPGACFLTTFLFFPSTTTFSVHMHSTMPKRKRDGSEASASDAEGVETGVSIRQHRVQHKLELAHKQLARAFKTAKGFEAQKSGRRRKTAGANSDEKEVARIEAETAALKVGRS